MHGSVIVAVIALTTSLLASVPDSGALPAVGAVQAQEGLSGGLSGGSEAAADSVDFEDIAGFGDEAVAKYGDFETYYATRKQSAEGHALEWMLANDKGPDSKGHRMRKTHPHSATDFEKIDADGNVIERWQCKRTLTADDVNQQKYEGHKFLTSREAREELVDQLRKEELKAARRGVPLSEKWQKVRKCLDAGDIVDAFPLSGKPLPSMSELAKTARRELEALWKRKSIATSVAGKVSKRTVRAAKVHVGPTRVAVRAAAIGGAAAILAETVVVWYRFESGELTMDDLPEECARSALRVVIVAGAEGALFALAPTPAGWVVIGVGVAAGLTVSAVDAAIDWWKANYGPQSLTRSDLAELLPPALHAQLLEPTGLDRWEASRAGDPDAWDADWTSDRKSTSNPDMLRSEERPTSTP